MPKSRQYTGSKDKYTICNIWTEKECCKYGLKIIKKMLFQIAEFC